MTNPHPQRPTAFRSFTLMFALMAAATVAGLAQTPVNTALGRQAFYIRLTPAHTLPGDEARAREKKTVVAEATYWNGLHQLGKVLIYGSAKERRHDEAESFALIIVQGTTEAEARSLAQDAPSVKQGIFTAEVLPMSLYLQP